MAITTEYRCDCCGHAQDCSQDRGDGKTRYMYMVGIGINSLSSSHLHIVKHREVVWCESCLEPHGLKRPLLRADQPEPKYPTFEDLVREIVKATMEERE